MSSYEWMWYSFAIILGALALALAIYVCFHVSRDRYCKSYHPGITHENWEEHKNGS